MRRTLLTVLLALLFCTVAAPLAFAQGGEALRGTLRGPDRKPVPDVTVSVSQDGKSVGSATTGTDGTWRVKLPGPGTYDITLDTGTLPKGIVPAKPGGQTLHDVTVRPDQQRAVIFQLSTPAAASKQPAPGASGPASAAPKPAEPEAGGGGSSRLSRVPQLLVAGIKYGAIIAITAIGLSLIFGATGLINFAHGELVTIGAVFAFFLNAAASGPGMQLIPATILAIIVGALVGGALEGGLWRPLRKRGTGRIQLFVISIGLSLFLRHIILVVFGSQRRPYHDYVLQDEIQLGPIEVTPRDGTIILLSFAVLVGVALMLQKTRIGKAMRAVADNRDLAESSGIDVNRVILVVWLLGGGLAALGGVFFGLSEVVSWDMGFNLLLLMFAGVILGGLGTAYGAMLGSIVVGLVAQLSTLYFPVELQNAWALGVLILVLLVRPQGILGRAQRVG